MNKFWQWMFKNNYGYQIEGKGKLIRLSDCENYRRNDLYCYPEKNHKQILIGYMIEYLEQNLPFYNSFVLGELLCNNDIYEELKKVIESIKE